MCAAAVCWLYAAAGQASAAEAGLAVTVVPASGPPIQSEISAAEAAPNVDVSDQKTALDRGPGEHEEPTLSGMSLARLAELAGVLPRSVTSVRISAGGAEQAVTGEDVLDGFPPQANPEDVPEPPYALVEVPSNASGAFEFVRPMGLAGESNGYDVLAGAPSQSDSLHVMFYADRRILEAAGEGFIVAPGGGITIINAPSVGYEGRPLGGEELEYLWNFGDGLTSTEKQPYLYYYPTHPIQLTITDKANGAQRALLITPATGPGARSNTATSGTVIEQGNGAQAPGTVNEARSGAGAPGAVNEARSAAQAPGTVNEKGNGTAGPRAAVETNHGPEAPAGGGTHTTAQGTRTRQASRQGSLRAAPTRRSPSRARARRKPRVQPKQPSPLAATGVAYAGAGAASRNGSHSTVGGGWKETRGNTGADGPVAAHAAPHRDGKGRALTPKLPPPRTPTPHVRGLVGVLLEALGRELRATPLTSEPLPLSAPAARPGVHILEPHGGRRWFEWAAVIAGLIAVIGLGAASELVPRARIVGPVSRWVGL